MKELKILNIIPSYYPAKYYGGVIFSSHYINMLISKNNKFKISVSTSTANGKFRLFRKNYSKFYKKNYMVSYYYDEIINRLSFSFIKNIKRDILNNDIIHIQDIFSTFAIVGVIISKLYQKKILISPRGSLSDLSLRSKLFYIKKIIFIFFFKKKNFWWHVTSEIEKKDLNYLGIYKNIFVIGNPTLIKKKSNLKYNFFKKKIIIGYLGRFHKLKRVDLLVNCLKYLKEKYVLLLAGPDFGAKNEIKSIIKKEKLNKRVKVLDNLNEISKSKFFNTIDLFALPSTYENFGNVFLEALFFKKPILTSKFTPFKDINKHRCGIVTNLNSKDMAKKINKFFQNYSVNIKNDIKLYLRKFNNKVLEKNYIEMYNKIYSCYKF